MVENPLANVGDAGDSRLITGSGRFHGLQYSRLQSSMDRGVWQATVHGAGKSQTQPGTHAHTQYRMKEGFPGVSDGKESACNGGDPGSIPRWGRSPGEVNGYPLQYSCLENSVDKGIWQVTVHGIAKSRA